MEKASRKNSDGAQMEKQDAVTNNQATILVVDDEDAVRRLTSRLIASLGYQVYDAPNAEEALDFCSNNAVPIDLLFTDQMMPRMTGEELAVVLKDTYTGLKVIYVSGYDTDRLVDYDEDDPTTEYLRKPFSRDDVEKTIRKLLI